MAMTERPTALGFLGCGFIARYHAMQLAVAGHDCSAVACHDPDGERAARFAREVASQMPALGSPEVCGSVEEVLDASDAVFVCTWTAAHRELVVAAADRGLPVFCEKPLGTSLADAEAVALALESTPAHAVGLVLRSSPAMLAVQELVRDPAAGAVMNVVFRDDQYLPVDGLYESRWRVDATLAGSGALLEHSIHDADLLEFLVGPIDAVGAHVGHFHGIDGIEDNVTAMGRYQSGATFSLASVWHDIDARSSLRRIEVFCANRLVTLEGDVFGPVLMQSDDETLHLEGDEIVDWLDHRDVPTESTETAFLHAVGQHLEGRKPARLRPDAADALRAHQVVDAMYRSAAAGGAPVDVPAGGTATGEGG